MAVFEGPTHPSIFLNGTRVGNDADQGDDQGETRQVDGAVDEDTRHDKGASPPFSTLEEFERSKK